MNTDKMPMPVWATPPRSLRVYHRIVRSDVFFGVFALLNLYALSTFFWRDQTEPIVLWGDGMVPLSYADKGWKPMSVSRPPLIVTANTPAVISPLYGNQLYRPINTNLPPASPAQWQEMPVSCLEEVIAHGKDCSTWRLDQKFDFTYTWANSSDPAYRPNHKAVKEYLLESRVVTNPDASKWHYRDYDELKHSMRSLLDHFRPYARQFTVLATDFPSDGLNPASSHRIGQMPQWLDIDPARPSSEWKDGDVQLKLQYPAEYFTKYYGTTFNSLSIESQLGNLRDIGDVFVYINDDMYFLRDNMPTDFYTSAYGFVFWLEFFNPVLPIYAPVPKRGELPQMRESNVLLTERFGSTNRPYRAHVPKVMSVSLVREMAETFPEAFELTAARPLRAVWPVGQHSDVHTLWMFPHFVIERHREGLLWSWAVARMGDDNDMWNSAAAWAELGGGKYTETLKVGHIVRKTLDDTKRTLTRAGYVGSPSGSKYFYSSNDGYPYYAVRQSESLDDPDLLRDSCTIARAECLPPYIQSASEAFKHIAFERPECGDCIINRLVQKSGKRGLSAALPSPTRMFSAKAKGPTPDTLPRMPKWDEGAFAIWDVLSHSPDGVRIDVRAWTLRMLNRYRFVIARAPRYEFVRLKTLKKAEETFDMLEGKEGRKVKLICMNDDVEKEEFMPAISQMMYDWQAKRFSTPAVWEA